MRRALLLSLCVLVVPNIARAQAKADPTVIARDLVGNDYRRANAAEDDLVIMDVGPASRAVLQVRALSLNAKARRRCDRVLEALLDEALRDLTLNMSEAGYGSIIALGGGMGAIMAPRLAILSSGGDEDEDMLTPAELQKKAKLARAVILEGGPAMAHYLVKIPPLRNLEAQRTLFLVAQELSKQTLDQLAALDSKAARARLNKLAGNVDLAEFVLARGCRDKRPKLRLLFQNFRDEILEEAIKDLVHKDFHRRQAAEETLFRLSALSAVRLANLVKSSKEKGPAVLFASVKRLHHRIRYGVSQQLFEKLGHIFENYEDLDFRSRREVCLEIERLGGLHGVPALRSIMRLEKSKKVRLLAALSLARLGDPVGIYRLQQEGLGARLSIPKGDLIAIYVDQGIKYMNIRRYPQAEKEFLRVLKLDSKNESALYNIACCYSLWGKAERALNYLEKAIKNGFDDLGHITNDPDLASLRDLPRYKLMIRALEQKNQLEGER
jgi:tetratricopeptide (TPR) repeat protein